MLLNIASFVLVLMFCLTLPGGVWLVYRREYEPEFITRYRKPLLWILSSITVIALVSMGTIFYEVSQIQERLRLM
jgi:amino acid transporter